MVLFGQISFTGLIIVGFIFTCFCALWKLTQELMVNNDWLVIPLFILGSLTVLFTASSIIWGIIRLLKFIWSF